jgi:hypothetical protein
VALVAGGLPSRGVLKRVVLRWQVDRPDDNGGVAAGGDVLWEAEHKGVRVLPWLRRMAVVAPCLGFIGLLLAGPDPAWVLYPVAAYVLAETAYWVWDRRRLAEVRVIADAAGGPARLRVRRVSGRTTEYDARRVIRVLVIYDNVTSNSAKLRLVLRRGRLFFGRAGRLPSLAAWRTACPRAKVDGRGAWWGMPGTDVD